MINPISRFLVLGFAILSLGLAGSAGAQPKVEWDVIKVGKRDYLSFDNVAAFYGLPTGMQPVEKVIRTSDGKYNLQVRLDSREIIINGVRNWLSFPVVQHEDGRYLISRVDLAKTIEPQFRPHMIKGIGRIMTVVVDPGHGGFDKGARNTYGMEKNYALDVAKQLRPLLAEQGFKVILTRESDVFIPLHVRARMANAIPNSIFVSIHFNATNSNRDANGFEIFSLTPRGAPSTDDSHMQLHFMKVNNGTPVDTASLALSTSIYHSMMGQMEQFDRGIKRARFAVLRHTKVPAVLVEGGFVSHRDEAKTISSREWRGKLAQAICNGVVQYRELAHNHKRPMLLADYRAGAGATMLADTGIVPPSPTQAPMLVASATEGNEAEPEEHTVDQAQFETPAEETVDAASVPPAIAEKLEPSPASEPAAVAAELVANPSTPPPTLPTPSAVPQAAPTQPAPSPTPRILHFSPPPKFQQ